MATKPDEGIYTVQTIPGVPWPGGHGWPAHAADPRIGYIEIDLSGRGDGPFGYIKVTADDSDDRLTAAARAVADELGITSGATIRTCAVVFRDSLGG